MKFCAALAFILVFGVSTAERFENRKYLFISKCIHVSCFEVLEYKYGFFIILNKKRFI